MMLEIYLDSALEPIIANEPLQATMTNLNAAVQQNMRFFLTKDAQGNNELICIPKITHIKELDS